MDKALIIYHSEDNDGLFSMAIIYYWLRISKGIKPSDICVLGSTYDKLTNMLNNGKFDNLSSKYKILVITDVSFNEQDEMVKLYDEFKDNFYWFDHHKPIIDFSLSNDLKNANGLRDTKHSALFNAWTYCFPEDQMPVYLKVLSAYDSFSFEQEGIDKEYATNVNQGTTNKFGLSVKDIISLVMQLKNKAIDEDALMSETFDIGRKFNEDQDRIHKKYIEGYGDTSWVVNGRKACVLFMPGQTSSDVFKSLVGSDVKNGIIFKHLNTGQWGMSLYNIDIDDHSFHCGDYLKEHYNGGGHEGAAGCTLSLEQFIEILKNKNL